jgi:hypothetical protein
MWLNHGTMGTTHGWFPQHGQTIALTPYFLLSSVCGFLKGQLHAHFIILFKGLKTNFAMKESLSQIFFYYMIMKP